MPCIHSSIKKPLKIKFLNCIQFMNHWPEITCLLTTEKHYKSGDLRIVKPLALCHRHVRKALTDTSSDLLPGEPPHKTNIQGPVLPDSKNCLLSRSAPQQLQENFSYSCKTWPTSGRMDQAHCGAFLLRRCSHGAFVWLQVAVTSQFGVFEFQCYVKRSHCLTFGNVLLGGFYVSSGTFFKGKSGQHHERRVLTETTNYNIIPCFHSSITKTARSEIPELYLTYKLFAKTHVRTYD